MPIFCRKSRLIRMHRSEEEKKLKGRSFWNRLSKRDWSESMNYKAKENNNDCKKSMNYWLSKEKVI